MAWEHLDIDDVRDLLRVVSDAQHIINTGQCASAHTLAELSRILHAQVGCVLTASLQLDALPNVLQTIDWGWSCERDRARTYQYYQQHPVTRDPLVAAALVEPISPVVAIAREDVISRPSMLASARCAGSIREARRPWSTGR